MAANAMAWPAALLPRLVDFMPENPSRSGGVSLTGSEQITVSNAGRWRARVTAAVRGESSNLALRAFIAQMEGRAGTVLVPKWELFRPSNVNGRQFSQVPTAGYSCDEFNFDLSAFGQSDTAYALNVASAAAGATRLDLDVRSGDGPRPGHYIGIGQRLYRVRQAWQIEPSNLITLEFWPRLRVAVPANARVLLDRPSCLMRFADDNTGDSQLNRAGSGMVTFDFIEAAPAPTETVSAWTGDTSTDNLPGGEI